MRITTAFLTAPKVIVRVVRTQTVTARPDFQDTDADNDGIPDSTEADSTGGPDTDSDGTPDFQDTDADNDGIPDSTRSR